jgi:hypothetical protein
VRKRPLYEVRLLHTLIPALFISSGSQVVGQLGLWGTFICGFQSYVLEHRQLGTTTWNGPIGAFLFYNSGR